MMQCASVPSTIPFITAALSQRKPASASSSHKSYHALGNDKKEAFCISFRVWWLSGNGPGQHSFD